MLISTVCPIDGTDEFDEEVYPANFDTNDLTPELFSARRRPDRIHYRMVRSRRSGCLRANPILDPKTVYRLYAQSHVTYDEITPFVVATYLRYADRVAQLLPDRRGFLEIGCGSGQFLDRMKSWGFSKLSGVELSKEAADKAHAGLRGCIHNGPIDAFEIEPGSYSLVAGFQVLDHVMNPNEMLQKCYAALCSGGVTYWICHDIGSKLARFLGERCPMVDIQHVVLYDQRTVAELFRKNGFEILDLFAVANRYPLGYWMKLAPLPDSLKKGASSFLRFTRLDTQPLTGYFGNMGIVARKPAA